MPIKHWLISNLLGLLLQNYLLVLCSHCILLPTTVIFNLLFALQPRAAEDIGAWIDIFTLMSVAAVATNGGLAVSIYMISLNISLLSSL